MPPVLSDVEQLARAAGQILRASYQRRPGFDPALAVKYKGEIDLVTEVDHQAEAYLLGEIEHRFPGHGVVAEESGTRLGDGDQRWFIDPIDGTLNYARGLPFFVVSLAYAEAGEVRLGVVYDPIQDECFSAERGRGACLNGEPIKVSETRQLGQSLVATGFPYDIHTTPRNNLDNFVRLYLVTSGIRHLGAAAQDLCYLAAGRLDGYWELRLNSWDVAAAGLIATEAGAIVTNIHGGDNYLAEPVSIVAANPYLHGEILKLVNGGN